MNPILSRAGGARPSPRRRARALFAAVPAAVLAVCAAPCAVAQVPNLGRNLAATCSNCHGTDGNARGDMKPLAGMAADKLVAMLADFKSGNLPATIMHQIAKGYTDEQVRLIAAYFAAQKPPAR
jgi:cytochrome c553